MDNTLQQGITAAKNGDRSHAYELLTRAAQDVSTAEQAWLWLSSVVDADSERLYCLNYVLRLNPNNVFAQRGAAALRDKAVLPASPSSPVPVQNTSPVATPPKPVPAAPALSTNPSAPMPGPKLNLQQASVVSPQRQVQPSASAPAKPPMSKQEALGLYRYAAGELARNSPPLLVEKLLVSQGTSPEFAHRVVAETNQALKKARRTKSKKRMIRGSLWTVGGIIVTALTYAFASQLGGTYFIFYGAIIFGLIDFFVGLAGWTADR